MSKVKRLLSYLFALPQGKYSDAAGNPLYVELYKGRYRLSTKYAVYSYDDLYDNFYKSFKKIDLSPYIQGRILVLGAGLGSIPYMLEKHFNLKAHYTIVEYDPNIIDLFRKYTLPRLNSNIEILQADAEEYIRNNHQLFDMVIIDIFIHDIIPEQFKSRVFLENCRKSMNEGATLLFNWMAITKEQQNDCYRYKKDIFDKVFANSESHKTLYNMVLQASL